ncbi:MAG: hypothetical protein HY332_11730 [Chloroflexi bacterium]|nr:hypothetical protein [Chloroflexota bacterium]
MARVSGTEPVLDDRTEGVTPLPNGAAAAALLAAGIGCAVFGLIIPLSEAVPALKTALNWWNPAGPLVGKTAVPVIVWLISWGALHSMWQARDVAFGPMWRITLVLVAIGFIGSFPPVFEAFTAR